MAAFVPYVHTPINSYVRPISSTSLKSSSFIPKVSSLPRKVSTNPHYHKINVISNSISSDPYQQSGQVVASGRACKLDIDGRTVDYDYFPGTTPTVIFLPGYYFSRWRQAKANALEIFAKRKGQAIIVEEYLGIGASEGDFATDGTLSRWISDTLRIIDQVAEGKVVLVGAGVGGWIMLHLAIQRPDRVVGLVGINPSLDFTEDLLRPSLTEQQKDTIEKEGIVQLPWGYHNYALSKALLEDAKKWLVLRGGTNSLNIKCPIRMLQGLSDEEVPPRRILDLVDAVVTDDVVVSFVKGGDHFLEEEEDFARMWHAVCDVSDKYYEYDLTSPGSG